MADASAEEDFVVEKVLDKRVGRTGKVSLIHILVTNSKFKSLIGTIDNRALYDFKF